MRYKSLNMFVLSHTHKTYNGDTRFSSLPLCDIFAMSISQSLQKKE